jgi:hypothetical protein
LSRILNTRKNNVSETGKRLALSKGPKRVGVSLSLPEDGNRSNFQNVCFLVFVIPDNGQSPKTQ